MKPAECSLLCSFSFCCHLLQTFISASADHIMLLSLAPPQDGSTFKCNQHLNHPGFVCIIQIFPSFRQPKRNGVAKLTFDLYKMDPKDFLCSCAIKATLYEMYTVSYDFRCTRMKNLFKWVHFHLQREDYLLLGPLDTEPPNCPK